MKTLPIEQVKKLCYQAMTYTKGYEDFDNWWSKVYHDLIIDKVRSTYALEFWEAYPSDFYSEGKMFPLRLMDYDLFTDIYNTIISGELEKHTEMMLDIEYAKANGFINYSIEKFIRSKAWQSIRKLRLMNSGVSERISNNDKDFE